MECEVEEGVLQIAVQVFDQKDAFEDIVEFPYIQEYGILVAYSLFAFGSVYHGRAVFRQLGRWPRLEQCVQFAVSLMPCFDKRR